MNTKIQKYNFKNISLNDKKTWALFSRGDTLGVFQLETKLGQDWAKRLKPSNIDELSALISILRPGPLASKMADDYCDRKNGIQEVVSFHPSLEPILKETYQCVIYQEQVMKIGIELAGMSEEDSDKYLRSGIGKKKADVIAECEKVFVDGCDKVGKVSSDEAKEIFSWIKKFARYGFNKCLHPETELELEDDTFVSIKDINIGDKIKCPSENEQEYFSVLDKIYNGKKDIYEYTMENGLSIRCTEDHKFLCSDDIKRPISEIIRGAFDIVSEIRLTKVKNIKYIGNVGTYDIEIDNDKHVFFANGLATSNSHAVSYAMNTYFSAYQKANFPLEFYTAWLTYSKFKPDPKLEVYNLVQNARINNIDIQPPRLSEKNAEFKITKGKSIVFGLSHIRGVGNKVITKICNMKLDTWDDFVLNLLNIRRNVAEALIKCGACDDYGLSRNYMLQCVYALLGKPESGIDKLPLHLGSLTKKELKVFMEIYKNLGFKNSLQMLIDNGTSVARRHEILIKKIESLNVDIKDNNKQKSIWEKLYLGLSVSCSAIDDKVVYEKDLRNCKQVVKQPGIYNFTLYGVVDNVFVRKTGPKSKKPGSPYAYLTISDSSGAIDGLVVWPNTFDKVKHDLIKDNCVKINGRKNLWNGRTQIICNDLETV